MKQNPSSGQIPKTSGQGVRTAMRYPPPAAGTSRRSPSASDTAATATAAVTAASVGQCDDRTAARRRSAPLGYANALIPLVLLRFALKYFSFGFTVDWREVKPTRQQKMRRTRRGA